MKINVPGDTPMARLTNLTKRIIAVPKADIERAEQKWQKQRAKARKKRR
jgi:hypothetical protein